MKSQRRASIILSFAAMLLLAAVPASRMALRSQGGNRTQAAVLTLDEQANFRSDPTDLEVGADRAWRFPRLRAPAFREALALAQGVLPNHAFLNGTFRAFLARASAFPVRVSDRAQPAAGTGACQGPSKCQAGSREEGGTLVAPPHRERDLEPNRAIELASPNRNLRA